MGNFVKTVSERACVLGTLLPCAVGNNIGCDMALWQTVLRTAAVKLDKLEKRIGNIDTEFSEADAFDAS